MKLKKLTAPLLKGTRIGLAAIAMMQFIVAGPFASSVQAHEHDEHGGTRTPIKHVIMIVGENRSFDHLFATYEPKNGQYVDNLLSRKIIKDDGTPGANYALAEQYSPDVTGSTTFDPNPTTKKALYSFLPAPLNGGPTDVLREQRDVHAWAMLRRRRMDSRRTTINLC